MKINLDYGFIYLTSCFCLGYFCLFYLELTTTAMFLKDEYVNSVVEMETASDRDVGWKLEIEGLMMNVVSECVPQVVVS